MSEKKREESSLFIKERLTRYQNVLEAIENVFRLQKSRLLSVEQLSRIEQIRHYDRFLLKKTYKDPRLFKRDTSGKMMLEKVYDEIPEESFDTYENRFVLFLLELVLKDVGKALGSLKKGESSLSFLKESISFGAYGTIRLLQDYLRESKKDMTEELTESLLSLYRKAGFLIRTPFSQSISPLAFESVEPTNLLLEQKDYRTCLDFFLERQTERRKLREEFLLSLTNLFQIRLSAKEENGILVGTDGEREYRLQKDDSLEIVISYRKKETRYALETGLSFFFPTLTLRNGRDERTFSFLEIGDLFSFLTSWTLLSEKSKNGICPICQTPLIRGHCPLCHADVQEDKDGIDFVGNVPFLKIGGKHEATL